VVAPRVRPRLLNTAIAVLFMVGSTCFAAGTVPAYADAVGGLAVAVTFFVGSLFFTSASLLQLLQAQTPSMTPGAAGAGDPAPLALWAPKQPHDRGWLSAATQFPGTLAFNVSTAFAISVSLSSHQAQRLVWRPDFVGSILFLVASGYGILAVAGRYRVWRPGDPSWRIAWVNMAGSVFFMMSAIGAFIIPATGSAVDPRWANLGTFLGAVCFFLGAALLIPAWSKAGPQASEVG
jgi:hypothetical protein